MTNEQLVIRIQAGIDVADNMLQLWQQNQGIIGKLSVKYRNLAESEDLKQEGYIALCTAVDHYRPDEGTSFLTYAAFWIKQRMLRYGQYNGTVRISVGAGEQARQYKRMVSSFTMQVGRRPTEREICYYLGVTGETLQNIQRAVRMAKIGSLDMPIEGTEDLTVGDSVSSPEDIEGAVLDKVQQEQLRETLWPLVDALPGEQPAVIRARFQEGKTLNAIGQEKGVTRDYVRQQEAKALRELRKPSRANKLRPFLYDDGTYSRAVRGGGVERFRQTWTSSTERAALGV